MNRWTRSLLLGTRVLESITGFVGNVVAWAVFPLTLITCYEVAARYLFKSSQAWTFELGYMITGAYFLLGAAYALRENAHIRIDVLYNRLSGKGKAVADLISVGVIIVPTLILIIPALWNYAYEPYQTSERSGQSDWNPLIWPFRFTFLVGFVFLGIQSVAQILKSLVTLMSTSTTNSMES